MAFVDTFICVPQRGIVDTSDQTLQVKVQGTKKRRGTVRERRGIAEEALLPGASVSRVARRHDVNANQVFYWRKLYREGKLGSSADTQLVAVKVVKDRCVEAAKDDDFLPRSGTREIKNLACGLFLSGRSYGKDLAKSFDPQHRESMKARYALRAWNTLGSGDAGYGLVFDLSQLITQACGFGAILC